MHTFDLPKILDRWDVSFRESAGNDMIQGSPERTVSRLVAEDKSGKRWILEQIDESKYAQKHRIAETLERLHSEGLSTIHPYARDRDEQLISCHAGRLWMLRPFIEGTSLNRKTYLNDHWRADVMADFLIHMRRVTNDIPVLNNQPDFCIRNYTKGRMAAYRKHRPPLAASLEPVIESLNNDFFQKYDEIRTAFCHGDYHPVNMIWSKTGIHSVIDWEFCGSRPETYDAALLLGCLGFDDPDALIGPLATRIIQRLHESGIFKEASWDSFIDLMIAIRFGWLSEWLRWKDRSAQKLEVLYMNLLTTQKAYIRNSWGM